MMERDLEIVRDSRRFPYKTVSDIVRHAVYRHIHWLHALEQEIPRHFLTGLEIVMEVMRDHELQAGMEQTFERLDRMIDSALAAQDASEAQRLLTLTRSKIAKLQDSRWRKRWLDKFSRKYSHYLQPGGLRFDPAAAGQPINGGVAPDSDTATEGDEDPV